MAVPTDEALNDLMNRYVCVRIVQNWGLDLTRFQFDGALTWAVFLMNADGTIYGRYGTRSGLGKLLSTIDMSVEGFKKTLEGGLKVHETYARGDETLEKMLRGNRGPRPVWKRPEEIPELKRSNRFAVPFTVRSGHGGCIHCHMVPTNEVLSLRAAGRRIADRYFWPYPLPDEIGLMMDPKQMATLRTVGKGSIAERSGFKAGDRIISLKGQPILSTADIQWVLHHADDPETIKAEIERNGARRNVDLSLPNKWRLGLTEWRFLNMGFQNRALQVRCRPLNTQRRKALGLKKDTLALRVENLNPAVARRHDLRRADVIVEVDGKREPMNLGAYTAYLLREKKTGDTLRLTILRNGKEHQVELKIR